MTTVALDTSVLMAPVEQELRLFDELDRLFGVYDLVTPAAVGQELAELAASGRGLEARAASVGRDLAERAATVETAASEADDAMVELAETGTVDAVATADRRLAERVLAAGVAVLSPRGPNTLQLTQP
jgi:rRNA-processing protein FCF1